MATVQLPGTSQNLYDIIYQQLDSITPKGAGVALESIEVVIETDLFQHSHECTFIESLSDNEVVG